VKVTGGREKVETGKLRQEEGLTGVQDAGRMGMCACRCPAASSSARMNGGCTVLYCRNDVLCCWNGRIEVCGFVIVENGIEGSNFEVSRSETVEI
jgi:hypothetical protein